MSAVVPLRQPAYEPLDAPGRCQTPGHGDRPGRPFARGKLCYECMPAPETAPGRYCLAVCYCGQCPHYGGAALTPITPNVIDHRAVASGKRRSSTAEYREAMAAVQASQDQQRGEKR